MGYSYVKFLQRTLSWEVATKLDIIHQTQLNVITMCRGLQCGYFLHQLCLPFQITEQDTYFIKGINHVLGFFLLFASLPSSRQEDGYHSFDCACRNKKETGRASLSVISLAQMLVVKGEC